MELLTIRVKQRNRTYPTGLTIHTWILELPLRVLALQPKNLAPLALILLLILRSMSLALLLYCFETYISLLETHLSAYLIRISLLAIKQLTLTLSLNYLSKIHIPLFLTPS